MVKSLRYIGSHSAEDLAKLLPDDFFLGHRAYYVAALSAGKSMFTADGAMPLDGPETVLKVMNIAARAMQGRPIELSRTFTNEFIDAVP